jgi:hypothetical protein
MVYGTTSFLFTGDAGSQAEHDMLASGDTLQATILKVGHHGSRNATPKELWKLFGKRKGATAQDGLTTLMSTSAGVYGRSEEGKVPSANLVTALKSESNLMNTQDLKTSKGPIVFEI